MGRVRRRGSGGDRSVPPSGVALSSCSACAHSAPAAGTRKAIAAPDAAVEQPVAVDAGTARRTGHRAGGSSAGVLRLCRRRLRPQNRVRREHRANRGRRQRRQQLQQVGRARALLLGSLRDSKATGWNAPASSGCSTAPLQLQDDHHGQLRGVSEQTRAVAVCLRLPLSRARRRGSPHPSRKGS